MSTSASHPAALDVTLVAHVFDVAHDLGIEPPERLLEPGAGVACGRRYHAAAKPASAAGDGRPLRAGAGPRRALPDRQSIRLRARFDARRTPGIDQRERLAVPVRSAASDVRQLLREGSSRVAGDSRAAARDGSNTSRGTRQGVVAVLRKFVPAGIHHILIGPDHLLFLVGLLLLGGSIRQLLLVVTAFTVAHSITLSLAALNIFSAAAGSSSRPSR